MSTVSRALKTFGSFWYNFLIGDTPEFFFGTLVVIGLALLLRHDRAAALVVVPVVTLALLLGSTYRARMRT